MIDSKVTHPRVSGCRRRSALWIPFAAVLGLAVSGLPALAANSATLVIKVVVPPAAAVASPVNVANDAGGMAAVIPQLGSDRYSVTLVASNPAAPAAGNATAASATGSAGYAVTLDGRPIALGQGRVSLTDAARTAGNAPSRGRLGVTATGASAGSSGDALQVVVSVN
jgi:hypothetical protein